MAVRGPLKAFFVYLGAGERFWGDPADAAGLVAAAGGVVGGAPVD
jgi:hypothetical protein